MSVRRGGMAILTVGAVMASSGCGAGAHGGGDDARFPTAGEIDKIGQAPSPARIARSSLIEVPSWKLTGVPLEPIGSAAHAAASPLEKLLADAAARRQGLLWTPESMSCLAHQRGLFLLAHGGDPSDELARFMAARCGVPEGEVAASWISGTADPALSDAQIHGENKGAVQQLIDEHLSRGNQIAGLWFGREKNKTIVSMVFAERRVRLDATPMRPDGNGHVLLRGELLIPAEHLEALSNYGKYGFRRCVADPKEHLPRFALDCELNSGDLTAVIEVAAFPPGRITGRIVADLLVWPSGTVVDHYERSPAPPLTDGVGGANSAQSLLLMLNQIRGDAGLDKVTLAGDESVTATRVAPQFFAALAGAAPEVMADRVVLGLRAGWQIPGLVAQGHFASSLTRDITRPSALLLAALNRPSGREALLDKKIKIVAIGPVISREQSVLAGVFSSYSLLDPVANAGEVAEVMSLLNQKRKALGLAPATLVASHQAVAATAARQLEKSERTPEQALNDVLQAMSSTGAVRGWFLDANDIDSLAFPDELVRRPTLQVTIGVAHYKPHGSPWGAYAVLAVTDATMVAANEAPILNE